MIQMGKPIYCILCPDDNPTEGTNEFQIRQITPDTEFAFRTVHTCDEHKSVLKPEREMVRSA